MKNFTQVAYIAISTLVFTIIFTATILLVIGSISGHPYDYGFGNLGFGSIFIIMANVVSASLAISVKLGLKDGI